MGFGVCLSVHCFLLFCRSAELATRRWSPFAAWMTGRPRMPFWRSHGSHQTRHAACEINLCGVHLDCTRPVAVNTEAGECCSGRLETWSPGCCAGWFNLLGQAAVTAGIDFALASHISAMWVLSNGYILTQSQLLLVYFSTPLPHSHRLMGPPLHASVDSAGACWGPAYILAPRVSCGMVPLLMGCSLWRP